MTKTLIYIIIGILALIVVCYLWGMRLPTEKSPTEPIIDAEARQRILLIMNYLSWENPKKVAEFNEIIKNAK